MSKPKVLIVAVDEADFFKTKHKPFLDLLEQKAEAQWASKGSDLDSLVANAKIYKAVFLADPGLKAARYSDIVRGLVRYVHDDGGIVICMGMFAAFINHAGIERFFGEGWDLPWTAGEYLSSDYVKNPTLSQFNDQGLDEIYNQKALCLWQNSRDSALYVPTDGAYHQQSSFMSESMRNMIQASTIYHRLGNGYLGYVGDADGEPETNKVIMAMAGLETS